ncbi:hypothetical protein ETAC_11775 [Edwardsiella piscicida C07-087]|nr:hypothetical protein ETAC_11775 [Edwardsiella piscicida C07-087]
MLAAIELQHLGIKINDALYSIRIPHQPSGWPLFEIAQMTLAGITDIRPGDHLSIGHIASVLGRRINRRTG